MAKKKQRGLVRGELDGISSDVFHSYHGEIKKLIGRHQGLYALYRKRRLYYVGLAKNVRGRVKGHLKDKHSKKWDSFSLFLINKPEILKELETLVLHIAKPSGNTQRGKFAKSTNLRRAFRAAVRESNKIQEDRMFLGIERRKKVTRKTRRRNLSERPLKRPSLLGLLNAGSQLRAVYKKAEYFLTVDEKGRIVLNGASYNSPSAAASAVRGGKATDGWTFLKYKDDAGRWVKLDELRKKLKQS